MKVRLLFLDYVYHHVDFPRQRPGQGCRHSSQQSSPGHRRRRLQDQSLGSVSPAVSQPILMSRRPPSSKSSLSLYFAWSPRLRSDRPVSPRDALDRECLVLSTHVHSPTSHLSCPHPTTRQYAYGTAPRAIVSPSSLATRTTSCPPSSIQRTTSSCQHPWTRPYACGTYPVCERVLPVLVQIILRHSTRSPP